MKYTLMHALLFGSLISAVDPVAVCFARLSVELSVYVWYSYAENFWTFHDISS